MKFAEVAGCKSSSLRILAQDTSHGAFYLDWQDVIRKPGNYLLFRDFDAVQLSELPDFDEELLHFIYSVGASDCAF